MFHKNGLSPNFYQSGCSPDNMPPIGLADSFTWTIRAQHEVRGPQGEVQVGVYLCYRDRGCARRRPEPDVDNSIGPPHSLCASPLADSRIGEVTLDIHRCTLRLSSWRVRITVQGTHRIVVGTTERWSRSINHSWVFQQTPNQQPTLAK